MLKKLKHKFILINMLLVGIVIVSIFSSICVITYITEENEINDLLEESLLSRGNNPYLPTDMDKKNIPYAYVFTVYLNDNGEIKVSNAEDINEDFIESAVRIAYSSNNSRGNIPILNLSYMRAQTMSGTVISFVSRENLQMKVRHSIIVSSVAGIISLLLFFYISKHLSELAIQPIEKAWEQQKQFLADASHDLKTPLTVILANNNILSSHKDESVASQMKWIESTGEEAGRMSELVNKMLELAKSENMKQELVFSDTDLSELAESSILQFEVIAFEKNVQIESSIAPSVIAKTHGATFSKILEILFDNAIKYSPKNEKITVSLVQSSQQVKFKITNRGEAIKKEDLPHIFERFYRTDKAREVGGHGLGLSIAKKLSDMIDCKISVESDTENGTTFSLLMKK